MKPWTEFSSRRRDANFEFSVTGFADGTVTLNFPRPSAEQLKENPSIARLRGLVMMGLKTDSTDRAANKAKMSVDKDTFLALPRLLIESNYHVTEAELTWLLSGSAWHEQMIWYAYGGKDALLAIGALARS